MKAKARDLVTAAQVSP